MNKSKINTGEPGIGSLLLTLNRLERSPEQRKALLETRRSILKKLLKRSGVKLSRLCFENGSGEGEQSRGVME